MSNHANDPDNIPNGAGDGDTNTDAPDTSSGGKPEDDGSTQGVQDANGAPVDNPSGG